MIKKKRMKYTGYKLDKSTIKQLIQVGTGGKARNIRFTKFYVCFEYAADDDKELQLPAGFEQVDSEE